MTLLGFTHPWMLTGLAAVGLPVLIHLLTRARPRRIVFPPLRFLAEACAGQQAVDRLRTVLLLTLRTLAVLALVLVFSRPFLKPAGAPAGADAARRIVFVLDASLSMRAVQRGVTRFAHAQAEAAEVLRTLDPASEAGVILAGATPRPLLPALSRNLPALHDALVSSEPTYEFGDPAAAVALALRMLAGTGTVFVLSDFQQSNWEAVQALPGGGQCRLRSVAAVAVDNAALTSLRVFPAEPVAGEPFEVVCTVLNCTPRPRRERVRLELGDFAGDKSAEVPAFGTADALFHLTSARPGLRVGRATLPPDDLREDNTRHLAVRVHPTLQMLLVSDADAHDSRSAAFFVSRALAPSPQSAPGYTLVRRHSQDSDRGVLETADAFVLVPPAMLTGEAAEVIGRRVHEGASLLVFLDGPTAVTLVPAAFSPPFTLLRTAVSDAGDPLVAGPRKLFADADAADWTPLRFRRHFQTQRLEGRPADVMLAYPDGSVALALSPVGKGAAVFANLPLALDGSDLVGSPLFPALVHEVLLALRRGSEAQGVTPGRAWTLEAPTHGDGPVTVTDPEDHPVEARPLASGRLTRLALPPARLPGVYSVRQADALTMAGVVNVDPRESDTRSISPASLKMAAGTHHATLLRDDEDLVLAAMARPLWPPLAAAAAILLAAEMAFLAAWRRRQPTRTPLPRAAVAGRAHPSGSPAEGKLRGDSHSG